MNTRKKQISLNSTRGYRHFLPPCCLSSGGASAKDHKAKGSDEPGPGGRPHFVHRTIGCRHGNAEKGNNKYYLYVQHSKDQGISIIDISKPAQPKTIGVIPWPDPAMSSRMNVTGDLAIIAETGIPHAQRHLE